MGWRTQKGDRINLVNNYYGKRLSVVNLFYYKFPKLKKRENFLKTKICSSRLWSGYKMIGWCVSNY